MTRSGPARKRHLVDVWNPSYASDAMTAHLTVLLEAAQWKGKLFWSDADRVTLLGLLLENVGMDRAVRLGNADLWRGAIRDLG
jgi:hypothetical protein